MLAKRRRKIAETDDQQHDTAAVEELNARLEDHAAWVKNPTKGKRLDLSAEPVEKSTIADKGVDWRGRNLRHASLTGVDLGNVDFANTDFTDVDLTDADLSKCVNLGPSQFGGAVLFRTRLPADFEFPQIATVEEMSKNCGRYFLTLLAACAYMLLTVLATKDAALITDSATSTLPILRTSVSITEFYVWAPVVMLLAYIFYLINMQTLWKTFATLPARFPDGRNIEDATYPWLVNSLARFYSAQLMRFRTAGEFIAAIVITIITYCIVPVTLSIAWLRTIRRHVITEHWQLFHSNAILISIAVYVSIVAFRATVQTLTRKDVNIFEANQVVKPSRIAISKIVGWQTIALSVSVGTGWLVVTASSCVQHDSNAVQTGILGKSGFGRPYDVDNANLSTRPDKWEGTTRDDCRAIAGANLSGEDLCKLSGEYAFLVNADLRGSDLSRADLQNADLRGSRFEQKPYFGKAVLQSTNVDNADFQSAHLDYADLRGVGLAGANLNGATLSSADLSQARLSNARIINLVLTRATLCSAHLEDVHVQQAEMVEANFNSATLTNAEFMNVNLTRAHLEQADFTGATLTPNVDLEGAYLTSAQLKGSFGDETRFCHSNMNNAILDEAELEGAAFDNATLTSASFKGTRLRDATFTGADIRGTDFRGALGLTTQQLSSAFGDDSTKLDANVRPPYTNPHWPHRLLDKEVAAMRKVEGKKVAASD